METPAVPAVPVFPEPVWFIVRTPLTKEWEVFNRVKVAVPWSWYGEPHITVRTKKHWDGLEVKSESYPGWFRLALHTEPPDALEALRAVEGVLEVFEERPLVDPGPLDEGQEVEVVDGPFSGFRGAAFAVPEREGKVRVETEVYGRPTPLELDRMQVRKV